ncbi:MAG: hypothetical protein HYT75_01280 [Deltaproteobacteria bacterium]|nr:hypothetical protein [Deltaproteobacteria bacterium]MBI2341421.1 hypothetical protein [Deltaproteobacteria bacterium]
MTNPVSPLIANDFQMYDTTPDGRLFLNEFGDGLGSFVEKYINTNDRNVRNAFFYAMENSTWEAVRKAIKKIAENNIEDNVLKNRIKYILEREFPDKTVSGNFNTEFEHEEEKETNEGKKTNIEDESNYELTKSTNIFKITQGLYIRSPLSDLWLLKGAASVTASQNWQNQSEFTNSESKNSDHSFLGSLNDGSLGFQTRDDFFKSSIGGIWNQNYQKPPPDYLVTSGNMYGGFEFNNLWKAFSIRGNVDYKTEKYMAPPPDSGFFQNSTNTFSINSEATYLVNPLGIVINHSYEDNDSSNHYNKDKTSTNSFATLAQYTWKESYLQAGGGYSVWSAKGLYIGDEQPTSYEGTAIYATTRGQYQITEKLKTVGSGTINVNESEGSFNGRYPSWSSDLKLIWIPDKWTTSVFLLYSGRYIDLNNKQTKHAIEAGTEINYRPFDSINFKVSASTKTASTEGKNSNESKSYKINGSFSYNVFNSIWLWTFAGASIYQYEDSEKLLSGNDWWSGAGAGINY